METTNFTAVTPEGTLLFPELIEPKSFEDSKPVYSCTLSFDKGDPKAQALFKRVQDFGRAYWGANDLRAQKLPMLDGDAEADRKERDSARKGQKKDCSNLRGKYSLRVKAQPNTPMGLGKRPRKDDGSFTHADPQEFSMFDLVRAEVNFFGYEKFGGGISATLLLLVKERAGASRAERAPTSAWDSPADQVADDDLGF